MRIALTTVSILIFASVTPYIATCQERMSQNNTGNQAAVFGQMERKLTELHTALNRRPRSATGHRASASRDQPVDKTASQERLDDPDDKEQAKATKLIEESRSSFTILSDLSRTRAVPEFYLQNLRWNLALLDSIENRKNPTKKDLVYIETVAADLRLKSYFAISRNKAGGDPFGAVNIVAHTKKDGNEVSGYEVWYVPTGWANHRDKFLVFDAHSSPTSQPLPPSNYLMWAKKDNKEGEKRPVSVGGDGRIERHIDLLAP